MSDTTTNYGLKKPKYGTDPDEAENLDVIDEAIHSAGGVQLQVNGVDNIDQALFNLIDGNNTSVQDNGDGSVQVNAVIPPSTGPIIKATRAGQSSAVPLPQSLYQPAAKKIVRVSLTRTTITAASASFTVGTIDLVFTNRDFGFTPTLHLIIPTALIEGPALGHNTPGDTYTASAIIIADNGLTITATWNGALSDGGGTFNSGFAFVAEELGDA